MVKERQLYLIKLLDSSLTSSSESGFLQLLGVLHLEPVPLLLRLLGLLEPVLLLHGGDHLLQVGHTFTHW